MTRILFLSALALSLWACQSPDDVVDASPGADPVVADAGPTDAVIMAPDAPLNLNTATSEEFATIPGVGDRMVHEFEEYRPYASIEQFRREIGKYVDEDVVAGYEEYVFVPVDPNESTVATMMQLPGVSEDEAQQLVDGRPYASADEFLTAYESIAGEPDAASASAYVEYE